MKLIIVRHGATDFNLKRVIQGQMDTELNEQGIEQAEELGLALADERIHQVFSSDLNRARSTTAAILRKNSHMPVEYSVSLRERHFGHLQNRHVSDLQAAVSHYSGNSEDFTPIGGESLRAFHNRVGEFWQSIRTRYSEKTVLISAHGGVCKSLITHVLDRDFGFRRELVQDNCCLNIISNEPGKGFVANKINSVAHLTHPSHMEGL